MTFSSDQLFLALVSLVRATRPAMLSQDVDGFSIDFEAIAAAKSPLDSDRLLLKLGAAMQGAPPEAAPGPPSPAEPPSGGLGGRTEDGGSASPEKEEAAAAGDGVSVDISDAEARQIAGALAKLEQLQVWPEDVLTMSRALRARLVFSPGRGC
jgi:hypothetical protein